MSRPSGKGFEDWKRSKNAYRRSRNYGPPRNRWRTRDRSSTAVTTTRRKSRQTAEAYLAQTTCSLRNRDASRWGSRLSSTVCNTLLSDLVLSTSSFCLRRFLRRDPVCRGRGRLRLGLVSGLDDPIPTRDTHVPTVTSYGCHASRTLTVTGVGLRLSLVRTPEVYLLVCEGR